MDRLERRDAVLILHLGSDENRFNRTSVDAINAALDEAVAQDGDAALVVTGDGRFFSNGLDLDWLMSGPADGDRFVSDFHDLLHRFLRLDMITVGAINGHAFAGGAMLAATLDFRVMREDRGYWCLPEVDLGLPLTADMFAALQQIPRATLAEAALTGRRYAAPEALAAGIVTHVASSDQLLDRAVEIAAANASKNRAVVAAHKLLLYGERGRA